MLKHQFGSSTELIVLIMMICNFVYLQEEKTETEKSTARQRLGFEKGASPSTYGDRSSREKSQSNSGSESPKPRRTRLGSLADEIDVSQRNGDSANAVTHAELQAFKQEILDEMRKEMDKMKRDIIEGNKSVHLERKYPNKSG